MSGNDSSVQDGVPQGKVEQRTWETSKIYPDTKRDYWVYVPEQYNPEEPACLMVFQDGGAYVHPEGQVKATTVFDNLIHSGEMPVTIGIFVSPGMIGEESTRPLEYVADGKVYSSFLLEEIIPEVTRDYNLVDDREGWSICGMVDFVRLPLRGKETICSANQSAISQVSPATLKGLISPISSGRLATIPNRCVYFSPMVKTT